MSRRAIDKNTRSKAMGHGQQAIWEEIRRLNSFTVTDLWGVVDMHRGSIKNYLTRLQAGGYIEKRADFEESFRFQLVRDTGQHAPRLTKEGQPVKQGTGTLNMWRTMRMMNQFTSRDLAAHSSTDSVSVNDETAKRYCSVLLKAEYLRVLQKAVPGKRQAIYKLIRNTGPIPPQVQRVKQLFDPNLNKVTYYPEVAS